MNISPTAQATLLLTSYFSGASREAAKPLTTTEWGRFALWLNQKSMTPADLLVSEPEALLKGWHDARISTDRIVRLLNRGHSLALAMEKWQRAGLWVVTRSDAEYPRRLKQRLKTNSPPVLFGCGNKELLNIGGLAVIGSRNASDADLSFTEMVGAKASAEGVAIVSGGARGVDEAAMLGAAKEGGVVIGVLADSLLRAATSAKWRKGLMNGHVVLVSPFYPEAGFNAGNAMARNKYIYCLADSSLVIHSGKKGGTINGAEENLNKHWVPLWVKPTTDQYAANADLVAKGGRWCAAEIEHLTIADLFKEAPGEDSRIEEEQTDLFSMPEQVELVSESNPDSGEGVVDEELRITPADENAARSASSDQDRKVDEPRSSPVDFYQLFIGELQRLAVSAATPDELVTETGLHKTQLNAWLKRATEEGVVKKLTRPVRYQVTEKHK